MATAADLEQTTRMLFLGDDSLADGFRLIGFETFPNPDTAEVEGLFRNLLKTGEKAFVIVDDQLMQAGIPALERVRTEGGRIVIASVPRLKQPPRLASDVAERLDTMFSKTAGGGTQ